MKWSFDAKNFVYLLWPFILIEGVITDAFLSKLNSAFSSLPSLHNRNRPKLDYNTRINYLKHVGDSLYKYQVIVAHQMRGLSLHASIYIPIRTTSNWLLFGYRMPVSRPAWNPSLTDFTNVGHWRILGWSWDRHTVAE
jgi:hypothetical protein